MVTKVFKNLSAEDIRESVAEFEKAINDAQIIMFPGGFSAGDEPDGSAKFFATAFQNARIKEAVMKLVNERDGLCLGICNGFQALIKLGLVPFGEIVGQKENSPTLTFNTINRHISKMVYTKVVSNKSPWLANAQLGKTYVTPASHGEGRFVADDEWIKSCLPTDRWQRSTRIRKDMFPWMKNGTLTVPMRRLKESPLRTDVSWARWPMWKEEETESPLIFMENRI